MLSTPQKVIILKILEPFDPARIGVFGSYARNEAKEESDIDILVHFNKRITLLDLIGMEQELSEGLKKKVDLVTENSLYPALKQYVMNDIIFIKQ